MLKLVERDSYLAPYSLSIEGRHQYFVKREKQFTKNGRQTLSDFATGYLYFGLHRTARHNTRVVLNTFAEADFTEHLHIIACALFNSLCFNEFTFSFKLFYPIFHLLLNFYQSLL